VDELRFDGRAVVVTGAGRGIGRSHALLLASRGAKVVVADSGAALDGSGSSRGPADEVVQEIVANGGDAVACSASVADEAGASVIVGTAIEHFGRLDVVVNNAGISDKHRFPELSHEQFRRMMDVHFFGTLNVTKAAWPHLLEAAHGRVVNTTSEGVLGAQTELTSYGAAKGAVWALTRNLAAEALTTGIRVNAVAPRARTRMSEDGQKVTDESAPDPAVASMLDRMDPDLVAPAMAYLAHESCRLNGEVLVAGGGDVMRLAPIVTRGVSRGKALSAEDVAQNIDAILDSTDARVAPVGSW
jgi:NAD(P)-dependent dehydrogenase (short-subunit alcohol dehydrogenase family)